MLLVFFTHEYPPVMQGGTGLHVAELASDLRRRGHAIHVFSYSPGSAAAICQPDRDVHFIGTPEGFSPDWTLATLQGLNDAAQNQAIAILGEQRPDVIHNHTIFAHPAAKNLSIRYGTPLITTIHVLLSVLSKRVSMSISPWLCAWEAAACSESDHLIGVSHAVKEDICTTYKLDANKIHTVHNGFDVVQFSALNCGSTESVSIKTRASSLHPKTVVFGGRIDPQKGLPALLQSAPYVTERFPAVRYLIAGDDSTEYGQYIKHLAFDVQRLENVKFVGTLSRNQLAEMYSIAKIAVVPSVYEPFGYAAIEAMALAVPVIASATGGLKEIIEDGVSGLLVPLTREPKGASIDVEALAKAQLSLLGQDDMRRRLGKAGQKRVAEKFTSARMAEQTELLYRQMLSDLPHPNLLES